MVIFAVIGTIGVGFLIYYVVKIDERKEEERILKKPRAEFEKEQKKRDSKARDDTPYDETIELLREIRNHTLWASEDTRKTLFWTRIIGIPVLLGMIFALIATGLRN